MNASAIGDLTDPNAWTSSLASPRNASTDPGFQLLMAESLAQLTPSPAPSVPTWNLSELLKLAPPAATGSGSSPSNATSNLSTLTEDPSAPTEAIFNNGIPSVLNLGVMSNGKAGVADALLLNRASGPAASLTAPAGLTTAETAPGPTPASQATAPLPADPIATGSDSMKTSEWSAALPKPSGTRMAAKGEQVTAPVSTANPAVVETAPARTPHESGQEKSADGTSATSNEPTAAFQGETAAVRESAAASTQTTPASDAFSSVTARNTAMNIPTVRTGSAQIAGTPRPQPTKEHPASEGRPARPNPSDSGVRPQTTAAADGTSPSNFPANTAVALPVNLQDPSTAPSTDLPAAAQENAGVSQAQTSANLPYTPPNSSGDSVSPQNTPAQNAVPGEAVSRSPRNISVGNRWSTKTAGSKTVPVGKREAPADQTNMLSQDPANGTIAPGNHPHVHEGAKHGGQKFSAPAEASAALGNGATPPGFSSANLAASLSSGDMAEMKAAPMPVALELKLREKAAENPTSSGAAESRSAAINSSVLRVEPQESPERHEPEPAATLTSASSSPAMPGAAASSSASHLSKTSLQPAGESVQGAPAAYVTPTPASSQNEPAPRQPAAPPQSPARVETVVEEKQAQPLRSFSLEFTPDGTKDVRLHVSSHGSDVHVSLHSNDAALSERLRGGMRDLAGSLQSAGYEADAWSPQDERRRQGQQPEPEPRERPGKPKSDSSAFDQIMQTNSNKEVQ